MNTKTTQHTPVELLIQDAQEAMALYIDANIGDRLTLVEIVEELIKLKTP